MATFTGINTTDLTTTTITTKGEPLFTPGNNIAIVFGVLGIFLCPLMRCLKKRWKKRRGAGRYGQGGSHSMTAGTVKDVAGKAKKALKEVYRTTGNHIQMHPWHENERREIKDIYTELHLVEQIDKKGKLRKMENKIESYEGMFKTKEENPVKRVVIIGSTGIGKTTLIDKIAYDWAVGNNEALNNYELVFVLKMHSLKQSSDLMDAIFDQLLDENFVEESVLKEFIYNNQDKVLILLDGFDELTLDKSVLEEFNYNNQVLSFSDWFDELTLDKSSLGSILKALNRMQFTECWVVITSRPPLDKLVNSKLVKKPYTHVIVKGFSNTDIMEYVDKFFPNDHDKVSKPILKEQIELSDTLSDLAKTPMLLLMMCLLWDTERTFPDTMTQLYQKALKYIFTRKIRNIKRDAISKILISIGTVALDRLISKDKSFDFRERDFEKSALAAAMNAGVLTSKRVIDGLDIYQSVFFIHHTFLEYCAAMYWQSLTIPEKFKSKLDQIDVHFLYGDDNGLTESAILAHPRSSRLSYYDYLLRFCCGDNEECTNRILQKVHDSRELALVCYFESQSKELPPENVISSVLTGDINITDWNDSKNAFFYFLKHVTALSRENHYFTKVEKLVEARFNFHMFGEVLAKSLELMTKLQSLSLIDSSLTTANIEKLLSSLASPLILVELDLSGNQTLGGSVSTLVPKLKTLTRLQKLHFRRCLLVAEDVSPITESVSDTLVNLDLSENTALGGCAIIWAPKLGKMECLEELTMKGCDLTGDEKKLICKSVRGVFTQVHLDQ